MPSAVGGDVVRILDLTNHSRKTKEIAATVLIDRLTGFVALGLIALLSIAIGYSYIRGLGLFWPVLLLFVFLFAVAAVAFDKTAFSYLQRFIPFRGLREKIIRLQGEVFYFRGRPAVLAKALVLSLAIQVLFIFGYCYIFLALGARLNLIYLFVFVPIIAVLSVCPVSIGGLGVRDMGSAFLFGKIGVSQDIAVATSLLNFGFLALIGFLCGFIYLYALCGRWAKDRKSKIAQGRVSTQNK